jgi:hypothetical protein
MTQAQWAEKVEEEVAALSYFSDAQFSQVTGDPDNFATWTLPMTSSHGNFLIRCRSQSDAESKSELTIVSAVEDETFSSWVLAKANVVFANLKGPFVLFPHVNHAFPADTWFVTVFFSRYRDWVYQKSR